MEQNATSLKKTARLAGVLYLLLALTAIYAFMYVIPRVIVPGDAETTARNMVSKEFFFRTGLVSNMIAHTGFVFLVLTLYRLFKEVNKPQARLMVGLVWVGVPIAIMADVFKYTALRIFKGDLLKTFAPEQAHDAAMFCLRVSHYSGQIISLNWGLWLIPLGLLVYQSRFIPRIFGILLFINAAAYFLNWFLFVLFPDYLAVFSKALFAAYFAGEIPLIFWLLIKGVNKVE